MGLGIGDWRAQTDSIYADCPADCPDADMLFYVSDGCYEATDGCIGDPISVCDAEVPQDMGRCHCPYGMLWDISTDVCISCATFNCPAVPEKIGCNDAFWFSTKAIIC